MPYVEELRASTKKGYREIWTNHISKRVGSIRIREFRTVDASRMLKAIADEKDLTKTTLQHIKSVLSGVFTHAKNEGAFDGVNPVQDARIPRNTREPGETFAYNLSEIRSILDALPLLPKAIVATAYLRDFATGNYALSNGPTIKAIRSTSAGRFGRLSSINRRREQAPRPFL